MDLNLCDSCPSITVTTFQIPLKDEVAPFEVKARPCLELGLGGKKVKICAEKISQTSTISIKSGEYLLWPNLNM